MTATENTHPVGHIVDGVVRPPAVYAGPQTSITDPVKVQPSVAGQFPVTPDVAKAAMTAQSVLPSLSVSFDCVPMHVATAEAVWMHGPALVHVAALPSRVTLEHATPVQSPTGGVHVSAAVKVHAPALAQVAGSAAAPAQAETTVATHVFGEPAAKVHAPAAVQVAWSAIAAAQCGLPVVAAHASVPLASVHAAGHVVDGTPIQARS